MTQILKRLTWFNQINVYLISTSKGLVLIDSAAPGMFGWLVKSLRKVGIAPDQLAGVVVTHFHIDHVGTAMALQRCGVPVYALAEEVPILMGDAPHPGFCNGHTVGRIMMAAEKLVFGTPSFLGVILNPILKNNFVVSSLIWLKLYYPLPITHYLCSTFKCCIATGFSIRSLEAGQKLFDTTWRVVAAPGHTPGSLALFNEDTGDLLSGDTLLSDFCYPRANLSVFTADYQGLVESALNLMALEPKYIHPGHGKPLPLSAYAKAQERLISKLKEQ